MTNDNFFWIRMPEAWMLALVGGATITLYATKPDAAPESLLELWPAVVLFFITGAMIVHCLSKIKKLKAKRNSEKEESRRLKKLTNSMPYLSLSVHQEDSGELWAVASVINGENSKPSHMSATSMNELADKAKEHASSNGLHEVMMFESEDIGRSFTQSGEGTWTTSGKVKRWLAMGSLKEAQKLRIAGKAE